MRADTNQIRIINEQQNLVLKPHEGWRYTKQNINLVSTEQAFSESLESQDTLIPTSSIVSKIEDECYHLLSRHYL